MSKPKHTASALVTIEKKATPIIANKVTIIANKTL